MNQLATSVGSACKTISSKHVPLAFDRQGALIRELAELTLELEGRLDPILSLRPPEDPTNDVPAPYRVYLASVLEQNSDQIYEVIARLKSMHSRIEL
jgi:hypothetical protein